jgi:RNase adaptor protein for sRNA GlmZ degradation
MNGISSNPNYNEDENEEEPFNITIVSYGHAHGPLIIPRQHAKLNFNVRDIPNPAAAAGLRRTHTGLSARLRKEILASTEAQERLAEMVKKVNVKMDEMEREREKERERDKKSDRPVLAKAEEEPLKVQIPAKVAKKYAKVVHQEDIDDDQGPSNTLVVGVVCEEGRHRSVTFADELAHSLKRRDWDVSVDHRDLSGYVSLNNKNKEESDSPTEVVTPTATSKPKTKKQKNQESRRRKTSQRGFLNDEDD